MCRLFGLHAGAPVDAEFWLIDAPDSLAAQSHRNPDGAGVGAFGAGGRPEVSKQPIAAWPDTEFARTARHLHGTTFIAHVRYASTGARTQHAPVPAGRPAVRAQLISGQTRLMCAISIDYENINYKWLSAMRCARWQSAANWKRCHKGIGRAIQL